MATIGASLLLIWKNFFNSIAWYNLVPDQTHVVGTAGYGSLPRRGTKFSKTTYNTVASTCPVAMWSTLETRNTRSDFNQREMPNSFSTSAIVGCVKPALRKSAKSSAILRSHNALFSETSPLWAR
jgi:hypothetical protein